MTDQDPLFEVDAELADVHEAETEAAWKRYSRFFYAMAAVWLAWLAALVLAITRDPEWLAVMFVLSVVEFFLHDWTTSARSAWRALFEWGEDAE